MQGDLLIFPLVDEAIEDKGNHKSDEEEIDVARPRPARETFSISWNNGYLISFHMG
jgi:hypothetical protein